MSQSELSVARRTLRVPTRCVSVVRTGKSRADVGLPVSVSPSTALCHRHTAAAAGLYWCVRIMTLRKGHGRVTIMHTANSTSKTGYTVSTGQNNVPNLPPGQAKRVCTFSTCGKHCDNGD